MIYSVSWADLISIPGFPIVSIPFEFCRSRCLSSIFHPKSKKGRLLGQSIPPQPSRLHRRPAQVEKDISRLRARAHGIFIVVPNIIHTPHPFSPGAQPPPKHVSKGLTVVPSARSAKPPFKNGVPATTDTSNQTRRSIAGSQFHSSCVTWITAAVLSRVHWMVMGVLGAISS